MCHAVCHVCMETDEIADGMCHNFQLHISTN